LFADKRRSSSSIDKRVDFLNPFTDEEVAASFMKINGLMPGIQKQTIP
jgi:hypothetical protein